MTFSNANIYYETSAVNYLVDIFDESDAIATKALQYSKGNIWYLSPITIWEILLTKDIKRREQIIFFCQHLFHDKLMNSPSEFITNYIYSGCPLIEKPYDFHSKLEMAKVWTNICEDKKTTFVYDYENLKKKTTELQKFSKELNKIIHRVVFDITINDKELQLQLLINSYYEEIKAELEYTDPEYHKVIKISILLILYNLCLEVDFDNSPYKQFWHKIRIDEPLKRLDFIIKKYKTLIFRGPIYQMAIMAYHQISQGQNTNRGLFMDCLHSIYITYAHVFITNDEHFNSLRKKNLHPNFASILHISELHLTTKLTKIYKPYEN